MTKRRADDWGDVAGDLLGDRKQPDPDPKAEASKGTAPLSSRVRASDKSKTPGGLIRRTVYVTPEEWGAVLEAAMRADVTAAEIVRRALRDYLTP
jgi:hypothetical protein